MKEKQDLDLLETFRKTVVENPAFGNLDKLTETLRDRSGTIVGQIGPRAMIDQRTGEVTAVVDDEAEQDAERKRWLDGMKDMVSELQRGGFDVKLSREQRLAMRAVIVLVGRPALLIQEGKYELPPDTWVDKLKRYQGLIEETFRSVGKIELRGEADRSYAGTGFLVGKDVIMTNRHVARHFCDERTWTLRSNVSAHIDFVEEYGNAASNEFSVTDVVGVHDKVDMALFKVATTSSKGKKLPKPLEFALKKGNLAAGRDVYTVGYPDSDVRADYEAMNRLFNGIFKYKRMAPGQVMSILSPDPVFLHDCTTLGGNSGSCVIDLETRRVVGLHFWGLQGKANSAVALWELVNDPLLKEADIKFA